MKMNVLFPRESRPSINRLLNSDNGRSVFREIFKMITSQSGIRNHRPWDNVKERFLFRSPHSLVFAKIKVDKSNFIITFNSFICIGGCSLLNNHVFF